MSRNRRSRATKPAKTVFTAAVRSIAAGSRPDDARLWEVLPALERLLAQELRRRNLWKLPPAHLGIIGYRSWDEPGALAELAVDAFEAAILRRLRILFAQLEVKADIEGLVRVNVRWFLRDRQRHGDPLGYRAWEVTLRAAERAVERGLLSIVSHGPPISAQTLLAFDPDEAHGDEGRRAASDLRRSKLDFKVASWNDELLPDLAIAGGRRLDVVAERLAELLPDLREEGIEAFRLQEVVAALRNDLRPRWLARVSTTETQAEASDVGSASESAPQITVLRLSTPDPSPEAAFADKEAAKRLSQCVASSFASIDDARVVRELGNIWWLLLRTASEEGRLPSQREVARALDIPRGRMPELFHLLRQAVSQCRDELGI